MTSTDTHDPRVVEPAGGRCLFPHHDTEETWEQTKAARPEERDHDLYTSMYGLHAPEAISPGHEPYALACGPAPIPQEGPAGLPAETPTEQGNLETSTAKRCRPPR